MYKRQAMSCSNSSKDEKNISNSGKTGVKQEDVKKPENLSLIHICIEMSTKKY